MDWSKAKTILIIAFVITNLILGFVLVFNQTGKDPSLSKDFIKEVERILMTKDIKLNTEIPSLVPSLKSLVVEYELIDYNGKNTSFFQGQGQVSRLEEGLLELNYKDESLKIKDGKILTYENRGKRGRPLTSLGQADSLVKDFLTQRKLDIEGMELSSYKEEEGDYSLIYSKKYEDIHLEDTYVKVDLEGDKIRFLERKWLNVKSKGDNLIYINSGPKALLDLISREEAYGKSIEEIDICYYFDPREELVEAPSRVRKGRTVPAWRIIMSDGEKIIIDNY